MPRAVDNAKTCSSCKRNYSPANEAFNRNRRTIDGLQQICKPCKSQMNRNWKHGLDSGEIDRMLVAQRGVCAICSKKPTDLVLDHDHATGKVRGLLCRLCNSLLGMCNDDVDVMKRAIDYVQKGRET